MLVLLPTTHSKLTMQWKGPYTIIKRHENGGDCLVKIRNKIKLYHISMLKKFFRRDNEHDTKTKICQICIVDDDAITNDVCDMAVLDKPTTNFNNNQNLSRNSKWMSYLQSIRMFFSDVPGLTKTITLN